MTKTIVLAFLLILAIIFITYQRLKKFFISGLKLKLSALVLLIRYTLLLAILHLQIASKVLFQILEFMMGLFSSSNKVNSLKNCDAMFKDHCCSFDRTNFQFVPKLRQVPAMVNFVAAVVPFMIFVSVFL